MVIIDWFTATFPAGYASPSDIHHMLSGMMGGLVGESRSGRHTFENGISLFKIVDGQPINVADIDFGGELVKNRVRIDIKGRGCSLIHSWQTMQDTLECFEDVKITRIDLAKDFLNGEYTIEQARDWYVDGAFNAGGRMPKHSTPGDWLTNGGNGRTLEVGRRINGKMLRCYEKGKQLGDPDSKWLRFEVEIRAKDRDIPLEIITEPAKYFAGAYKALEALVEAPASKIETHQKEGEISLSKLVKHMKEAYGRAVNVLRLHVDADEIIEIVSRPGVPARLEKAALIGSQNWWSGHHQPPEVQHERL